MGPDEHASREELAVLVRYLFARFKAEKTVVTGLIQLLVSKGFVSLGEVADLMKQLAASPETVRAKQTLEDLREFAAIHKIARQYLDLPPDDL